MKRLGKRASALNDAARVQGFALERTKRGWRITDIATNAVLCDGYTLAEIEGFLGVSTLVSEASNSRARRRRV